jgi:hypothetical protein
MATIAELEAKIKKAKANSMMPENLKKQYIAKIEKEMAGLQKSEPKSTKSKAEKSEPKKKGILAFEADVIAELEEEGEMTYSDASGMLMITTNENIMEQAFEDGKSAKETAKKILGQGSDSKPLKEKSKKLTQDLKTKEFKIKSRKATEGLKSDYDCDKIIADLKARKEKAKKAAKKADKTPTVNKDETAIEKIGDRIKKHYKEGELTQKQIVLLIRELTEQINELKKLLKK